MTGRNLSRLFGTLALGTLAACAAPTTEEVGGSHASVTQKPFDRNNVIDDKSMRDATALTAEDMQKFLEKTPWSKRSVLADYEEGGKSAATIMVETAKKYGINPLEMVTRVQMEQGLISKTTAPAATIAKAFGCGCPDGSACANKYAGFAAQAECAAGTLSRSMDRALTSTGTVSGWKRSGTKKSQDGLDVVPKNAATAALYTYTPWVGEAGGGRSGVGGTSLHYQVWGRFAEATSYGEWASTTTSGGTTEPEGATPDAGTTTEEEEEPTTTTPAPAPDAGADSSTTTPDSGTTADAGSETGEPEAEPSSEAPPSDGSEDEVILGEGSTPPSSNAPPTKPKSKTPTKPEELPEASEEELASKKSSAAGCAAAGGTHGASDMAIVVAAVGLALGASRRRRSAK